MRILIPKAVLTSTISNTLAISIIVIGWITGYLYVLLPMCMYLSLRSTFKEILDGISIEPRKEEEK